MTDKKTDTVTIEFTSDEFEMLQEMVSAFEDCGPRDEGWKSTEARQLDDKITAIWNERHKDVLSKYVYVPNGEPAACTIGSLRSDSTG